MTTTYQSHLPNSPNSPFFPHLGVHRRTFSMTAVALASRRSTHRLDLSHKPQCKQCHALQEKFQGEAYLSTAVNSAEDINMTAVFLAMDCYKRAVVLTRERDIELGSHRGGQAG